MAMKLETADLTASVQIGADINGESFQASFEGWYDTERVLHGGSFMIPRADLPPLLEMPSTGSSLSVILCLWSTPLGGARNLVTVLDGPFEAELNYAFLDDSNESIGELRGHIQVGDIRKKTLEAEANFSGWWKGPDHEAFASPPTKGYAVHLRQTKPGTIRGDFAQTLECVDGTSLYLLGRRTFKYLGSGELPFNEVQHYCLLDWKVSVNGSRTTEFMATSFYTPINRQEMVS